MGNEDRDILIPELREAEIHTIVRYDFWLGSPSLLSFLAAKEKMEANY